MYTIYALNRTLVESISLSLQCKGVFTVSIQLSRTSNASGLIQKRCGSYALAVVRHLFCIKPSVISHFTYCLSCHLTRISLGKEDHSQVNPMRIEIPWGMSYFFLCVLLFQLYYHTALYFKITDNNFVNIFASQNNVFLTIANTACHLLVKSNTQCNASWEKSQYLEGLVLLNFLYVLHTKIQYGGILPPM